MKTCNHCGCINDSINRFCRNCGTRFADEQEERQSDARERDEQTSLHTDNARAGAPGERSTAEDKQKPALDEFFNLEEQSGSAKSAGSAADRTEESDVPDKNLPAADKADEKQNIDGFFTVPAMPDYDGLEKSAGELTEMPSLPDISDLTGDPPEQLTPAKPYIDFDFTDVENVLPEKKAVGAVKKIYSTHPVINAMKQAGASGGFLFFCILFTASVLLGAANQLLLLPSLASQAASAVQNTMPDADVSGETVLGMLYFCVGILLIPSVLGVIGIWRHYASAANRKRNWLGTGGLSLLRGVSIVNLVLAALFGVAVLLELVLAVVTLPYFGYDQQMQDYFYLGAAVIVVAVSVVCTLAIVYEALFIRSIGKLKKTAKTGDAAPGISVFVIVMNFLFALLCAPLMGYALAVGNLLSLAAQLCRMVALVALACWMIRYRDVMKELQYRAAHPQEKKL